MPGLTVTEKEHWKQRIAARIDRQIETICVAEPNFLDRIVHQARQRAVQSLGLAELQAELDRAERESELLADQKRHIERAMLAIVRGVPIDAIDRHVPYGHEGEIFKATERRQKVHEAELLAESDLGRRILQLRLEKEHLLDTVWLATSPVDVKTLWSKVNELLGDDSTPLQRAALAIPPAQT